MYKYIYKYKYKKVLFGKKRSHKFGPDLHTHPLPLLSLKDTYRPKPAKRNAVHSMSAKKLNSLKLKIQEYIWSKAVAVQGQVLDIY